MKKPNDNTLLFIADISGFTRFINEVEINHGSHIISELLEIVIDQNNTGLELAEIEGDAVFFYKKEKELSTKELILQSKKMFKAFHEHLLIYERDRICQCGACVEATNLSLKFIGHNGQVLFKKVSGNLQLMGKEVTKAHKLLKNDIEKHEYILLTESFNVTEEDKINYSIRDRSSLYEDLGEVPYFFSSMVDFRKSIDIPESNRTRKKRIKNPILKKIRVNASLDKAHETLIDLSIRPQWKTKIIYDESKIERIGTSHECILPQGNVMGYVVDNIVKKDEIIYEEYTDRYNLFFPSLSEVYHLKPISENSCEINVEFHVHTTLILRPLWTFLLSKNIDKGINKFVKLAEEKRPRQLISN